MEPDAAGWLDQIDWPRIGPRLEGSHVVKETWDRIGTDECKQGQKARRGSQVRSVLNATRFAFSATTRHCLRMVEGGTRFARPCEVSRTTIGNYLEVLEATFLVHVVRPFSSRRQHEIIAAPKVHGFDTGFVCYHRGWHALRAEDRGVLWEHFVLNEMQAHLQIRDVRYWREARARNRFYRRPSRTAAHRH